MSSAVVSYLRLPLFAGLLLAVSACATSTRSAAPNAAINAAMQTMVERQEVAGVVTLVATRDGVVHLGAVGMADVAANHPMSTDALFWIASMTKPITGVAIMMLQDAGKLSVDDPVAKYLPELAKTATADGTVHTITLKHLLTHSSGLAESTKEERDGAKSLADLMPGFSARPLQFAPGSRWQYCQSGINSLGRVIEVVSGKSFPSFLQERLFTPLGMVDTTFYPDPAQVARLASTYKREGDVLIPAKLPWDYDPTNIGHYPAPNGGLFSTASDYGRFCRLLLNDGALDGRTYLSKAAVRQLRSVASGDLKTGFTDGNGWGLGVCVVRQPQGVSAALSAGSYGHGGAFGTQAWIDPVKGVAYVLMVQRSNFPNSDNSDVRKAFQEAAVAIAGPAR
ncbi:MAG: beta-lactamase family protein [Planctomycetes bacterium]|nr:beta-lactamase family protein [Planctomycetota bacterium]